jgi:hypothetical protein
MSDFNERFSLHRRIATTGRQKSERGCGHLPVGYLTLIIETPDAAPVPACRRYNNPARPSNAMVIGSGSSRVHVVFITAGLANHRPSSLVESPDTM